MIIQQLFQGVLDVAAKDSFIVGTVGNLEPGKPEFAIPPECGYAL